MVTIKLEKLTSETVLKCIIQPRIPENILCSHLKLYPNFNPVPLTLCFRALRIYWEWNFPRIQVYTKTTFFRRFRRRSHKCRKLYNIHKTRKINTFVFISCTVFEVQIFYEKGRLYISEKSLQNC